MAWSCAFFLRRNWRINFLFQLFAAYGWILFVFTRTTNVWLHALPAESFGKNCSQKCQIAYASFYIPNAVCKLCTFARVFKAVSLRSETAEGQGMFSSVERFPVWLSKMFLCLGSHLPNLCWPFSSNCLPTLHLNVSICALSAVVDCTEPSVLLRVVRSSLQGHGWGLRQGSAAAHCKWWTHCPTPSLASASRHWVPLSTVLQLLLCTSLSFSSVW